MPTRTGSTLIEQLTVAAYRIPTDLPESDGTLEWDSTTMVLVSLMAGGKRGLGFSYADTATATLVQDMLAPLLIGREALDIPARWQDMVHANRNLGRPGIVSMAISAVDIALWDIKAKLFDVPLSTLLGAARRGVAVYGSGGFTSYTDAQLCEQFCRWTDSGITRVKMKIGRESQRDITRAAAAAQRHWSRGGIVR